MTMAEYYLMQDSLHSTQMNKDIGGEQNIDLDQPEIDDTWIKLANELIINKKIKILSWFFPTHTL